MNKLCTVCGILTGRSDSRCSKHARLSSRSRHNPFYTTREWQHLSARVLRAWRGQYGDHCPGYQRDAHPASDLTVDHVVPLATGGAPLDIANCAVLCRSCNSTKGASQGDRGSPHAGSALLEDRDEGWHLFAGFLVAAFRPLGPYLVLVLYGEQGSAKSTTTKIIRLLVDPGRSPLRAEPREQQDLLIAARNNWMVAFDNVSHFPPWMSDALCRLSTGGGLGKRQLYTDQDEIVLDAQRPQVINGITEFVTRGDLLDRSIIQEQPTIRDQSRRSEDEFWKAFDARRPQILGALFDAVSAALANQTRVVLQELPRMADPTRWVTAAEPALGWPAGTFAAAYRHNRREGSALALDAALIAGPLVELAKRGTWQGTAAALLSKLGEIAGDEITGQREWPRNPRALTEALKRLAPDLRATGVEWTRLDRTGNTRPHLIRWTGDTTVTTVTTDTARTNPNDGRALNVPEDRHSGDRTVTADRAPNDGHDGHDGPPPAPLVADPRVRPPILPSAVSAEESTLWTA